MPRHLPPVTTPPNEPQARRHAPIKGRYRSYRECVLWDFGFSCAYCLLTQTDFSSSGFEAVKRWSLQIDHVLPRATHPARADDYSNCVLACSNCNLYKSDTETGSSSARLLNPTADAWGAHFDARGDELTPRSDSATLTAERLQINSDFKRTLRRTRATEVRETLVKIQEHRARLVSQRFTVLNVLADPNLTDERRAVLAGTIDSLEAAITDQVASLQRWTLVLGGVADCRCAPPSAKLPSWIDNQLLSTA